MARQFLVAGDENPQYNVAEAPLVPPIFAPFFIAGLITLLLRPQLSSSVLVLGLVASGALPTLLTNEITHGLRVYVEYAFIPQVAAASLIAPCMLAGRFRRAAPALAFGCLAGILFLAIAAALQARQIYADYWTNAREHGRAWHIHGLDLSHSEWFFRSDATFLADWIIAHDSPLLIPLSNLDYPPLRAQLMSAFPAAEPMPADFELPPQTLVIAPWSLEHGTFTDKSAQLALLQSQTITILPPLLGEEKTEPFTRQAEATELIMPDSAYPAVARIQALPAGWAAKQADARRR